MNNKGEEKDICIRIDSESLRLLQVSEVFFFLFQMLSGGLMCSNMIVFRGNCSNIMTFSLVAISTKIDEGNYNQIFLTQNFLSFVEVSSGCYRNLYSIL